MNSSCFFLPQKVSVFTLALASLVASASAAMALCMSWGRLTSFLQTAREGRREEGKGEGKKEEETLQQCTSDSIHESHLLQLDSELAWIIISFLPKRKCHGIDRYTCHHHPDTVLCVMSLCPYVGLTFQPSPLSLPMGQWPHPASSAQKQM